MELCLKDASVKYGNIYALKNFTYEFRPGKIYCILGENGSGKSTLVKTIVEKYKASGEVSYVAQEMLNNMELTTLDVVSLGRYNPKKFFSGMNDEDNKLIDNAINIMELNNLRNRIVDTLSGGEKQRVMTARAIAQNTSWTILDEPSSSLDVRHTKDMMNRLIKLKEEGKSFIVVLHDINLASSIGDEFLLMKKGDLLYSSSRLELKSLEETFDTSFGEVTLPDGQVFFYTK